MLRLLHPRGWQWQELSTSCETCGRQVARTLTGLGGLVPRGTNPRVSGFGVELKMDDRRRGKGESIVDFFAGAVSIERMDVEAPSLELRLRRITPCVVVWGLRRECALAFRRLAASSAAPSAPALPSMLTKKDDGFVLIFRREPDGMALRRLVSPSKCRYVNRFPVSLYTLYVFPNRTALSVPGAVSARTSFGNLTSATRLVRNPRSRKLSASLSSSSSNTSCS